MALTNPTAQVAFFDLILKNQDWSITSDAMTALRGGTAVGSLYASLHSADPQLGGSPTQDTSETDYVSYARVALSRANDTATWTIADSGSATTATNAADITFPTDTGGVSKNVTHVGIGCSSDAGATPSGTLLFSAQLNQPLDVNGKTPTIPAGSLVITLT